MSVRSMAVSEWLKHNMNIAGFGSPGKALYTAVRELIENGLDAAEEMGVLPEIKVRLRRLTAEELRTLIGISEELRRRLDEYVKRTFVDVEKQEAEEEEEDTTTTEFFELTVGDNGIGMRHKDIPELLGKVLTSTKYELRQQRGRFGLGGKMVIIYGIVTTATPVEVWSAVKGSRYVSHYVLAIDLKNNRPIVVKQERIPKKEYRDPWGKPMEHGTVIRVRLRGNWLWAKRWVYEYLKLMAVITPYATFLFEDPDGNVELYERITAEMPKKPKPAKYHPHGVDVYILRDLMKATKAKTIREFFLKEFQGVTSPLVEEFLRVVGIPPETPVEEVAGNNKLLNAIVEVAKKFKFRAPSARTLSPLGPKLLEEGIRRVFDPEFVCVVQRKPFSYQGHPMIVELGVAYGGSKIPVGIHLYRFANRVPLLHKTTSDVSWYVISKVNWSKYLIDKDEDRVAIFVSVVSTKIPFTETSKDFIDPHAIPLRKEIRLALLSCLRKLKQHKNAINRQKWATRKREMLMELAGNLASSLWSVLKTDEEYRDDVLAREDAIFSMLIDLVDAKLGLVIRTGEGGEGEEVAELEVAEEGEEIEEEEEEGEEEE